MNTQKRIGALETKLAELSAELQRLKGQRAGRWYVTAAGVANAKRPKDDN
jgi:ribosome-interacting GTPase 1